MSSLVVDKNVEIIEFDPWGALFLPPRRCVWTTPFYCRVLPERYPTRRINPGENPESKMFLTGYDCVNDYPLVIQKSW